MTESKFYHFLQALSLKELKRFRKYMESPYFNTHEKIFKLFEIFEVHLLSNSKDPIVKEKVCDNFESQYINEYILWTETTILSPEKLLASLKKDWFINTYFSGIYTNYYTNYKINTTILFPVMPNLENFEYLAVQEINKYTDQEDQLIVSQIGKIDTGKTNPVDYLQFLDEIEGAFEAKYTLDPIDNSIKNITMQCSLAFANPKRLIVEITLQ